jgi:hypothetical protein
VEILQEQFDAARACGCTFLPVIEAEVPRLSMQRRIFMVSGKPVVATRDGGGFYETHATLAELIGTNAHGAVPSREETPQQAAAADAVSEREMAAERGAGGAQEVRARQGATGPRRRGANRRE